MIGRLMADAGKTHSFIYENVPEAVGCSTWQTNIVRIPHRLIFAAFKRHGQYLYR